MISNGCFIAHAAEMLPRMTLRITCPPGHCHHSDLDAGICNHAPWHEWPGLPSCCQACCLAEYISLVDLTASHGIVCILLHSPIGDHTGAKRLKCMGWHPSTANNLPFVSAMDLGDMSNIRRSHKSALGAVQDTRQRLLWTDTVQGVRGHGRAHSDKLCHSLK